MNSGLKRQKYPRKRNKPKKKIKRKGKRRKDRKWMLRVKINRSKKSSKLRNLKKKNILKSSFNLILSISTVKKTFRISSRSKAP